MDTNAQALHNTLKTCISLNVISLTVLIALCYHYNENNSSFMKIGPQKSLVVLGITIDTMPRYIVLQVLVCCFQVTDVLVNEFASPILGFSIYNPDKKVITEFTKLQLQIYCQTLWLVNSLKSALMILVSISQIDIAIGKVIYAEVASIYTIRVLLNKKKFAEPDQEAEILLGIETA